MMVELVMVGCPESAVLIGLSPRESLSLIIGTHPPRDKSCCWPTRYHTSPVAKSRLNLVVLRVADIERSAAFYRLLGLDFIKHAHGSGPTHYASESDGFVFDVTSKNSVCFQGTMVVSSTAVAGPATMLVAKTRVVDKQ